jgi:biotin carboxylase
MRKAPTEPVKKLLLVMSPHSYRSQAFLDAARRLRVETMVAMDASEETGAMPIPVDLEVDFRDPDAAVESLIALARSRTPQAIVAIDDGALFIASRAAEAVGLPYNPCDALRAASNKYEMRRRFAAAGVPSPAFRHHTIYENPRAIAAELEYPVVVKPLHLSGSRGVIRADDDESFVAAFERLARLLREPGTGPEPKSMLVETYLPGFEVELEGILADGVLTTLAILDKPDPLEGPFFEETILTTPSRLPAVVQGRIEDCAGRAAAALGLRTGPVHAEMRIDKGEPWMLELAARSIGGQCSKTLLFAGGTSLEELILRQALGDGIGEIVRDGSARGVMMIPIPKAGFLMGVSGVAAAQAVPGIEGVQISLPPGSRVVPLPEGAQYLGFIFAVAPEPAAAEAALREAHRQLTFDIRDEPVSRVRIRLPWTDPCHQ